MFKEIFNSCFIDINDFNKLNINIDNMNIKDINNKIKIHYNYNNNLTKELNLIIKNISNDNIEFDDDYNIIIKNYNKLLQKLNIDYKKIYFNNKINDDYDIIFNELEYNNIHIIIEEFPPIIKSKLNDNIKISRKNIINLLKNNKLFDIGFNINILYYDNDSGSYGYTEYYYIYLQLKYIKIKK